MTGNAFATLAIAIVAALVAVTSSAGIAIGSAIVALATLVVTTIMGARTLTRAADAQRVSNLEYDLGDARKEIDTLTERVSECERGRAQLRSDVQRLQTREIELLRRLVRLEEGP